MRQISRIQFALPVLCLVLAPITALHAQSSTKAGTTKVGGSTKSQPPIKQAAPKAGTGKDAGVPAAGNFKNPPVKQASNSAPIEEPLSPELEGYLKKWAIESKKIKSIHGDQIRQEFNTVFAEEKRTKGQFFLQTPDKGRIDFVADKIGKDEVSKREDSSGTPFRLETGQSERWICNGEEILVINDQERTIQRQEIPEEQRGNNIVHSPLPFLFGMTVEESKARFLMKLIGENPTRNTITIEAHPRTEADRQNYIVARIILSRKTWLPEVVQLLDESNMEIRYTFRNVEVNNDKSFGARIQSMFKGDPYHPKLAGYKEVLPPEKQENTKPEVQQKPGKVIPAARRTNPTLNIPGPNNQAGRTTSSTNKK